MLGRFCVSVTNFRVDDVASSQSDITFAPPWSILVTPRYSLSVALIYMYVMCVSLWCTPHDQSFSCHRLYKPNTSPQPTHVSSHTLWPTSLYISHVTGICIYSRHDDHVNVHTLRIIISQSHYTALHQLRDQQWTIQKTHDCHVSFVHHLTSISWYNSDVMAPTFMVTWRVSRV